jgi:biopolymer transport protein ExbB
MVDYSTSSVSMFELLSQGPIVFLLLGSSLLALGIFLERYFYFHRSVTPLQDFLQGISNLIRNRNVAEALHVCAGTPGPVARVVHAALLRHDRSREELGKIVTEAGQLEVPKLERFLAPLLSIAYVAPLLGLLGSVLGLMDTFQPISTNGFASPADLSGGIYRSLVTSAVGLAVAIPAYVLYAYLASCVQNLMHEMERAGIEVVSMLTDGDRSSKIMDFKSTKNPKLTTAQTPAEDESSTGKRKKGVVTGNFGLKQP